MSVPVQTPEILQLINNVIVNLVTLIELFGLPILQFGLVFFVAWLIYQVGVLCREYILKM